MSKAEVNKEDPEVEDHTWVIDSLVQFLSGPVWNKPISAFIEKKSTVFEPDSEQDTPEHRLVHKEYRNLVDSLLGAFVEELQISPTQFQNAVSSGGDGQPTLSRFQPGALLEQVWAASDFGTFNRLMGLRNLELQLQALDSIRQHGNTPMALVDDGEGVSNDMAGEERLLKHVLRRSMDEASIMERMKKFNRLSLAEPMTNDTDILKFDKDPTEDISHADKKVTAVASVSKTSVTKKKKVEIKSASDHVPSPGTHLMQSKLTEDEIRKRKEYLCQQRDKLLQAKGRTKPAVSTTREQLEKVEERTESAEPEEALQLRRALVNRLKAEIINKN